MESVARGPTADRISSIQYCLKNLSLTFRAPQTRIGKCLDLADQKAPAATSPAMIDI